MTTRRYLLNAALALVALSAALLGSTRLVPDAYAALGGCTVTCPDKSTCSGNPEVGETCNCTCTFWGLQTAKCTCQALRPAPEG
ncbi:MAG TPA: hypothetical protein VF746_18945 [Longimicrobium sp.]|jgi:hypothetical protein